MHVLQDIDGVVMARGTATKAGVTLVLAAPSGFHSTGYFPAESLTLVEVTAVAALRQLCEELLEAHAELAQEVA